MTQQEENNILMSSFLERTFFKSWKDPEKGQENFRSVELFINTRCDLDCAYCYLRKHGAELYPPKFQDDSKVLKNLELVLDWFVANRFAPHIEFFSGEPLTQKVGLQTLDMILDRFEKVSPKPSRIVVPTNYTFLLSETLTQKVEKLLERSKAIGMPILLSASFDGKYCEDNRPFKYRKDDPRDDSYYDKAFAFSKKWKFAFHPMIWSKHIEDWQKNFLWFQKMLKKYDIPWENIYLLEVRDKEWDVDSAKKFGEFIDFLIRWIFNVPCQRDVKKYVDAVFRNGFNILRAPLTTVGRGMGCSIQSNITIRLGDLAIVPCHRTAYEPFIFGHLIVKNGKITGVKADNSELMIGIMSMEAKNQPICESCLLRHLCTQGCLGSQFEATGDLFTPIPTVCRLQHAKIAAMVKTYKELGISDLVYERIRPEKKAAIKILEEMLYKK